MQQIGSKIFSKKTTKLFSSAFQEKSQELYLIYDSLYQNNLILFIYIVGTMFHLSLVLHQCSYTIPE